MNSTITNLEAEYRELAQVHGGAFQKGNYKIANISHDKLFEIFRELRSKGVEGEAVLRRLMRDPSISIASWAATHSLPFAESEALEVLDALAQQGGIIAFSAEIAAKQWRAGKLKIQ